MNYENLHTYALEKLFGSLILEIVKQDDNIRIIKINDGEDVCRTFGVVRFLNIDGDSLKEAHSKIIAGALLGKTLYNSEINFNKELIGAVNVKLPKMLQEDFKSKHSHGIAFYSKIYIDNQLSSNTTFLYSELIEIIPLELKEIFADKINLLNKVDNNLLFLLKEADVEITKIENKL